MTKEMFAQIFKIDEAKHEVWGIATEETKDADGETFNYEASKPYFEEWSKHAFTTSGGKSKGNIREMHQLEAVGKVIDIKYDDANKRITIGTKIVSDSTWQKIVEGVLTGFSIGGKVLEYAKGLFTCKPVEISVVDLPCLPTAIFEVIKADGSVESRYFKQTTYGERLDALAKEVQALKITKSEGGKTKRVAGEDLGPGAFAYVGDKNDPSTWKLPIHFSSEEKSKRHVRNALARFNQTQGIPEGEKEKVHSKILAAAKKYGIDSGDEAAKTARIIELLEPGAVTKAVEVAEVSKSLGNINDLTTVLMYLKWVLMDTQWEAMYEGDGGDERDAVLAVEIEAAMEHLVEIANEMLDEETSELLGKAAEGGKGASMIWEEVRKKAKSMADHFRKSAENHGSMAECYKDMDAEMAAMGDMHKAMMATCKAAEGDDDKDDKKSQHTFHKGMMTSCKAMSGCFGKAMKASTAQSKTHSAIAEGYDMEEKAATNEIKNTTGIPEGEEAMTSEEMKKAIADGLVEGFKLQAEAQKAATANTAEKLVVAPAVTAEDVTKAVEASATTQKAEMAATITKAVTDAITALDIPKMVETKVEATLKAAEAAPSPVPNLFRLVPRDTAKAAVGGGTGDDKPLGDDDPGL